MTEPQIGANSEHQLLSIVERVERLAEEKQALVDDIKEVFAEAKSNGFDTSIIRKVIARRRQDTAAVEDADDLLLVYEKGVRNAQKVQQMLSVKEAEDDQS